MEDKDTIKKLKAQIKNLEEQLKNCYGREEDLENSIENYRILFENANDGILTTDKLGYIRDFNPYAEKKTGFEKEELIGKHFRKLLFLKDLPIATKLFKETVFKGKSMSDYEINVRCKNGKKLPVELNTSPVHNLKGEIIGGQIIARDISERKIFEKEKERIYKRYKYVIDNMMDGFVLLDKDFNILEINKVVKRLAKLKKRDVIGKNLLELYPIFIEKGFDKICKDVMKTGKPVSLDYFILPTDWDEIFKSNIYNVTVYKVENGFSIIFRDIAENIRYKEELENYAKKLELANIELERASSLKNEFLANTTHELRTPLNSIIGFLRIVIDDLLISREEEKEVITDAYNSALHLLSIINDILDIAKIEAGKIEIFLEKVNIFKLLNEVKGLTHVQAEEKNLSFTLDMKQSKIPAVYADRGKLKQVFINVIGNAIKFTEKGGIKVKTYIEETKGFVIVEISDTGVGFPKEKLNKLFKKFSQLDSSFTRKRGGTGLGLAISKSLIEMMKGEINLYSDGIGKGTTAIIKIPVFKE